MKKHTRLTALIIALLLVALVAAGCSAPSGMSAEKDAYYRNDDYYGEVEYEPSPEVTSGNMSFGSSGAAALPENHKWIINVDISAETEDLPVLLEQLAQQIIAFDGYTERQNLSTSNGSNRYADLTVRVPADKADAFLEGFSQIAHVTSNQKNLDDVTLTYVATESRVKALETEEARLLELLAQAENLGDILSIEDRLTEVRYELEYTASSLRALSNRIDYATIELYIREVTVYTPAAERTVWQRIGDGFTENLSGVWSFLQNLFVMLISGLPTLLLLAAFIVPGIWIPVHFAKKGRKAKPENPAKVKTAEEAKNEEN